MHALQLVLFDLDDTLFDHQYSRRCGLLALQATYPPLASIPIETLVAEHERQLVASYDQVLKGTLSLSTDRLERFQRVFYHFGIVLVAPEGDFAIRHFTRAYEEERQAVPGIILPA